MHGHLCFVRHSARSAERGSTRIARTAGMKAARPETGKTAVTVAANVSGSDDSISNSRAFAPCITSAAVASPMTRPMAACVNASPNVTEDPGGASAKRHANPDFSRAHRDEMRHHRRFRLPPAPTPGQRTFPITKRTSGAPPPIARRHPPWCAPTSAAARGSTALTASATAPATLMDARSVEHVGQIGRR